MSFAAKQDTRFGTGQFWQERLEALTSHVVLDTLQAVEPLGPKKLVSALVIAPCTGATLARLAAGLSDTPVTLAAKSLLRVGCPVVVGVSTNDGLGASWENMAGLCPSARCTGRCAGRAAAAARSAAKQRLNGFSAGVKCGILLSDALPVQYDGQKNAQWRKTR